jgi:hypothetical protein
MSTLVNLLFATVVSILGGEFQQQEEEEQEQEKSSTVEIIRYEEKSDSLATYFNIADDLKFRSDEI